MDNFRFGFSAALLCALWAPLSWSQTVAVTSVPRPFTVVPPTSWVQASTLTGNSRVKFVSPDGTPPAECAVIVQDIPDLRGRSQEDLDQVMGVPADPGEISAQLSASYNNVGVLSTKSSMLFGHPAQLINSIYSVGSPAGEVWARTFMVSAATTPGITWVVGCGATGSSKAEAQKGYSHWQSEIVRFHTNLKLQKGKQ